MSEYLTHFPGHQPGVDAPKFYAEWGIDTAMLKQAAFSQRRCMLPRAKCTCCSARKARLATSWGKTTGWIHRTSLKAKRVGMTPGVQYEKIDDAGLHIRVVNKPGVIAVDNIILCAGQEPQRELYGALQAAGCSVHLIGGADVAAELGRKACDRPKFSLGCHDLAFAPQPTDINRSIQCTQPPPI